MSDRFFDGLAEGSFVAMFFENYNITPVIGKVLEGQKQSSKFITGKAHSLVDGCPNISLGKKQQPWVKLLPKSRIVCCNFVLNDSGKLKVATRNFLKTRYKDLKRHDS